MTSDEIAVGIGTIVALGVASQLLARRLNVPAILFLLLAGVLAGPVTGLVDSDDIFGDALFPIVNLGVGLLLFQGGMELNFRRLPDRPVLARLLTVGMVVTGVLSAVAAGVIFDLPSSQAAVIGAVLIVSGPTVIAPLVSASRLAPPLDRILSAEGTFIDPLGAAIGYVTVEIVTRNHPDHELLLIVLAGVAVGLAMAGLLLLFLRSFLVPDEQEVALGITCAVLAVTIADAIAPEAGLVAATVLGVALANQNRTAVGAITRFSELLNIFVIGSLFVLLAARVDLDALADVALGTAALAAAIILVIRPLAVLFSTTPSALRRNERLYLAAIAPRGVVAAATASLFTLLLEKYGQPFPRLVPIVFGVIFGTALVATLIAGPLAGRLGVRRPDPVGLAIVGWDDWALGLGRALHGLGVPVTLLAPGAQALRDDLGDLPFPVITELPSDETVAALSVGAARLLVATDIPAINRAAAALGVERLGRRQVYVVPLSADPADHDGPSRTVRVPFSSHPVLADLRAAPPTVRVLGPGEEPGDGAVVLARVSDGDGDASLHGDGRPARAGEHLVVLDAAG